VRLEILDAPVEAEGWVGAVLCRDILDGDGHALVAKGRRLSEADAAAVAASADELHLLWLDPGDVDEDSAAVRLADAIAGSGVNVQRPVESQVRLTASRRGLARLDTAALVTLNSLEGITVFTVPDGMPAERGATLAGVKITPLAIPEAVIAEAERLAAMGKLGGHPLSVQSFVPLRLAAVVRQRISDDARRRFEDSLRARAAWFGGSVASVEYPSGRVAAVDAVRRAAEVADLVLVVGVASVDPLESTWTDLIAAGASVIRRGLPVHPGSSYWLVKLGAVPVIGVASCGMLSRRSALDLLLLRCFAGDALDRAFLAGLGEGGLLGPDQAWRIPNYGGRRGEQ